MKAIMWRGCILHEEKRPEGRFPIDGGYMKLTKPAL